MLKYISIYFLLLFSVFVQNASAQSAIIEGYVYEANNRGYLNLVDIVIKNKTSNTIVNRASTDPDGFFSVQLPLGFEYSLTASKDLFEPKEVNISTKGVAPNKKVFAKIEMKREPGYLFDVTLAEKWDGDGEVDAIQGALIEIYNNTKKREELVLANHPNPYFKFTFAKGNHYTLMIRKKGFFTKRMEAYVDIEGCILCFDGLDEVSPAAPGASDNLTAGHEMGTIVANVELLPIKINEGIKINNIYYDLAKWDIRPDAAVELDKLIVTLKSNPSLVVELGSHTDSRGSAPSNRSLSDKRAKSAVQYILENSSINANRLTGKGYGETELVNKCADGVRCSEKQHQQNRRTELKIVGFLDIDPFDGKSLAQIIEAENMELLIEELQNQAIVEIPAGETLPADMQTQFEDSGFFTSTPPMPATQTDTPNTTPTDTQIPPTQTVTTTQIASATQATPPKPNAPEFVFEESTIPKPTTTSSKPYKEYQVTTQYISRPPKPLSRNYSGYKIEFYTANSELPLSHNIFARHGNITIEERKDGRFAYLLGNFPKKELANSFLMDIMQRQYEDAKVVKYNNGKRSAW